MNQYINEQALLYINELKNKEALQINEKRPKNLQKAKRAMNQSALFSILARVLHFIHKRAKNHVIHGVRPSRGSS